MEGNTELPGPQKLQRESLKPEDQSLEAAEAGWLKALKGRFNRVFLKEQFSNGHGQEESLRKIAVDIYYSEHYYPESWSGLKEKIKEYDIYVPEKYGATKRHQQIFNNVSFGRMSPERAAKAVGDRDRYPLWFEFFKNVYGSDKLVISADVPNGHPIYKKGEASLDRYRYLLMTELPVMNFTDVLKEVKGLVLDTAGIEQQREAYI